MSWSAFWSAAPSAVWPKATAGSPIPPWESNHVYRRIEQAYLAWADRLRSIVDEAESAGEYFQRLERAPFAVYLLTSALAP